MADVHHIGPQRLTIATLAGILKQGRQLALGHEARQCIEAGRSFLEKTLSESDEPIYGINTGFGALCHVKISKHQIEELQHNLVVSHACGTGDPVPQDMVRLMLLLKVQSLSYGHSGVRTEVVERLIAMYNHDVLPVVYEQGSLGASGDLAPLAHLSLPLFGEGEVWYQNEPRPAAEVLAELGWQPIVLKAKEGLALLNGTQFMGAYACMLLIESHALMDKAEIVAALSTDAYDCRSEPFDALIHHIRRQPGQVEVAARMRHLLAGSEIASKAKTQVQDPYSFRCIPQVHGASRQAIAHVREVVEHEINGVTDNPNIFPEEGRILSGGNFHGQPLALALDYLAIALAELGSIAERRTYLLLGGKRGLPEFLTSQSGLHSGLMIPQYTAAAIASQNKQLCTPASVDSIVSSNGQEDHVSMGANAATKAWRVLQNVQRIQAIELLAATQALGFRAPLKTSPLLEGVLADFRKAVPFDDHDRAWYRDIETTLRFLEQLDTATLFPEEAP
jgi:histidine ammonia-lyase